jgi:hypothetical protein
MRLLIKVIVGVAWSKEQECEQGQVSSGYVASDAADHAKICSGSWQACTTTWTKDREEMPLELIGGSTRPNPLEAPASASSVIKAQQFFERIHVGEPGLLASRVHHKSVISSRQLAFSCSART